MELTTTPLSNVVAINDNLRQHMNNYYIGPLVYEEEDGVRYYRFVIHFKENNEREYDTLVQLLFGVAVVIDKGHYLRIQISPMHMYPMMVRDQVVKFIEEQLGNEGYVDRYTKPAVARKVSGVVRKQSRPHALAAHAQF